MIKILYSKNIEDKKHLPAVVVARVAFTEKTTKRTWSKIMDFSARWK
jgi:hypothetical protein